MYPVESIGKHIRDRKGNLFIYLIIICLGLAFILLWKIDFPRIFPLEPLSTYEGKYNMLFSRWALPQ